MFAKNIFLSLVFIYISGFAFSQERVPIAMLSKPKSDGIWLRWAPTSLLYWNWGNKYGYAIERFTLQEDGDIEPQSNVLLTKTPLKPYSKNQFQALAQKLDEVAALEELLYGDGIKQSFNASDLQSIISNRNDLENRYGIALLMCDLSVDAAIAGGLFYKDATAQKGKRYIYRIKIAHEDPQMNLAPVANVITFTEESPLLQIVDLKAEFGNKTATISWATLLHKGIYTAYHIEKSVDGKNFTRMSKLPYVHMTEALDDDKAYYLDSLEVNNKKYHYRIKGITPFAETGPASNIVSGEGKDNLYGQLILREGKIQDNGKIKLEWEFPVEMEKQIAGFMLLKANNPEGPFISNIKKPLPKNLRNYQDETTFNNTYFVVQAVDKDGKELSRSFPYLVQTEDNMPPATPAGLSGNISELGIANITWAPNTDADLLGYRVFKANKHSEELIEVTTEILKEPFFTDSVKLKILNKKIIYSVIAVDKNYNTSDYSPVLTLNRPDIIPPAAPVFTNTEIQNGQIRLEWINSGSDDIANYELSRFSKNDRLSKVVSRWNPASGIESFDDKILEQGKVYQYILTAYDSAGNFSEAKSREIFYETGVRKGIANIKASVDREAKHIDFKWNNHSPAVKCMIYKKKNDEPITLYQTIDGNIESFKDSQISINNTYTYKIQMIYDKGIKSQLSQEVKVTY